jgi:hypothetical protein
MKNKPVALIFVGNAVQALYSKSILELAYALTKVRKRKVAAVVDPSSEVFTRPADPVEFARLRAKGSLVESRTTVLVIEREKRYEALVLPPRKYFSVVYTVVAGVRAPMRISVVGDFSNFDFLVMTAGTENARAFHISIKEIEALEGTALVKKRDISDDMYRMLQAMKAEIHDNIDNLNIYASPDYIVDGQIQKRKARPVALLGTKGYFGGRRFLPTTLEYYSDGSDARVVREKLYETESIIWSVNPEQSIIIKRTTDKLFRYDSSSAPLLDFDADIPAGLTAVDNSLFYVFTDPPKIVAREEAVLLNDLYRDFEDGFEFYIKGSLELDLSEDRIEQVTVYFRACGDNSTSTGSGFFSTRKGTVTISGGRITHINVPKAYRYVIPTVAEEYMSFESVFQNVDLISLDATVIEERYEPFATGLYSGYIMGRTDTLYERFTTPTVTGNQRYNSQRTYSYSQYKGSEVAYDILLSPGGSFSNLTVPFTIFKDGERIPAYTVTGMARSSSASVRNPDLDFFLDPQPEVVSARINFPAGGSISEPTLAVDLATVDYYDSLGNYRSFYSPPIGFSTLANEKTTSGLVSTTNFDGPVFGDRTLDELLAPFQGLTNVNIVYVDSISEAANTVDSGVFFGGYLHNLRTVRQWRFYSTSASTTNSGRIYTSVAIIIGAEQITMRFKDAAAVFLRQYNIRLTPERTKLPLLLDTVVGVLENPIGPEGTELQQEITQLKDEFNSLYIDDYDLPVETRPSRVSQMTDFLAARAILTDSTFTSDAWRSVFTDMLICGSPTKLICIP